MSKQYGLILPGQEKKKPLAVAAREISRPSIFDESSDSDEDCNALPTLKAKSSSSMSGPGMMEKRMAKRMQEKALEQDPTVFQYDELYDEMDNKREEEKQTKSLEPRKPKYVNRLLEFAEKRKLENELRVERQVQKEREAEGEQFKEKEAFVTSSYRKKLEEMRKLQEQEKRDEYLEAIGDVTKQKDLDGFYRHLYEQKTGSMKEVKKPELPPSPKQTQAGDEEIAYKPINSERKNLKQRAYRKRHSDEEEEDSSSAAAGQLHAAASEQKKVHLSNNMDADSDFSIDSSSSEDESENKTKETQQAAANGKLDASKIALKLDLMKKETEESQGQNKENDLAAIPATDNEVKQEIEQKTVEIAKPKKDKSEIWKKRTVGEAFDAAVQRYFQRRAARCA